MAITMACGISAKLASLETLVPQCKPLFSSLPEASAETPPVNPGDTQQYTSRRVAYRAAACQPEPVVPKPWTANRTGAALRPVKPGVVSLKFSTGGGPAARARVCDR